MKTIQLFVILICSISFAFGQEVIDGNFEFQTDPAKKYSLYIPSSYDESNSQKLMLALHPFNTSRWDGQSWRDTLIVFAEENDLLLVCPDGGIDGQIDSPIDTAFTTTLLDSVRTWYNIDESQKYVMGFSWGGRTTYTYGLRRTNEFAGYLVIGAAANLSHVSGIIENAKDEKFFLIHGTQDNPASGFDPFIEAIEDNNGCVESNLLSGVGHTIDFPNRNALLTEALNWLLDTPCLSSNEEILDLENAIEIYPNPNNGSFEIASLPKGVELINIYDQLGRTISYTQSHSRITLHSTVVGQFFLQFKRGNLLLNKRISIH